ncbi:hypothetical protein R9C00_23810 [Flammeovirgaceae bacterium SG7u.111]|nr:hypothetical protein [Flammeovirgaceae bacterium SG7u.132]WPO34728.1 hypothetical protein R9C00_23810 [Flammeovirgaceae bacterium SG7u.111]
MQIRFYSYLLLAVAGIGLWSCGPARLKDDYIAPLPSEANNKLVVKIQFMNDVIRSNPNNDYYYYKRSLLNLDAERINAALRDINGAIQRESSEGKYFFVKAKVLKEQEEYGEALAAAKAAERKGFILPELDMLMGELCYLDSNREDALAYLRKAQGSLPSHYQIPHYIGSILVEMEDTTAAVQQLNHALELYPGNTPTYNQLIGLYNKYQAPKIALEYANKGLDLAQPDDLFYYQTGEAVEKVFGIDSSNYWYDQALRMNKQMWEANIKKARYELKKGAFSQAETYYKRALVQKPDIENGYFELGYIYEYYLDDLDEALVSYKQAATVDSTNTRISWNIRRVIRKINFREFSGTF